MKQNEKKKNHAFTLIELLMVIMIIAIVATLMISGYKGIEEHAQEAVSEFNGKQVSNFIENFKAVNGAYPSDLHTGLKEIKFAEKATDGDATAFTETDLIENMPPVVKNQFTLGVAEIVGIRNTCLSSVGISRLAYGVEGDLYSDTTATDLVISRPTSTAYKMLAAIKITGDWRIDGTARGDIVRFNGMSMNDLLINAPWVAATENQTIDHSEQVVIYALFMGPTTNTQAVWKSDGSFWKNSKATLNVKLSPNAQYWNYPVLFFRLSKTKATFLGALTISDDGSMFLQ